MYNALPERSLTVTHSHNDDDGGGARTLVVVPASQRKERTRTKRQPPYAVIIENDEEHSYAYVIDVLSRVCGHEVEKAFQLAQQIDLTGRASVWTGTLEVAELKRDQIRGFGPDFYATKAVRFPLGVTVEPMPGD